jgi:hypothetical protein
VSALFALLVAGCVGGPSVRGGDGGREPDALFHLEPRWLGADSAYSVDLGGDRTLWLFGDSFIATSSKTARAESTFARNSVAVMTGRDPSTASMQFAWTPAGDAGVPTAFFPAPSPDTWCWPAGGLRFRSGPLLVFLAVTRETPNQGLGFTEAGFTAVIVDNPDDGPDAWHPRRITAPLPAWDDTVKVGNAVVIDGDFLVSLTSGNHTQHTGWLVRWPSAEARAGDLSHPQWWNGEAGWVAQSALTHAPVAVLDDAGPECSLHFDAGKGQWVHVASHGFGASTVAIRTAPAITGPWSTPVDVFTPPESYGAHPFVYAAKAHPELVSRTAGALVVTYATNSFTFSDLFTPDGIAHLYWPRFAEISF